MEKNYYHVRMRKGDQFKFSTPSAKGRKLESLNGASITRQIFADGNEILTVFSGERVDFYASFPIEIKKY